MSKKKTPLISIITVSYNAVTTIEQTILSVVNQDFVDYEYIIVDGGSTDGTVDIIKQYQDKITIWISEPDKGIYDAMNKGIRLAKGKVVGLLNSDDWYETDSLIKVAKYIECNLTIDIFHGLLRIIDLGGNSDFIIGHYSSFLEKGMIEHPTCFIRKSAYEKIGDFSLLYKSASDFEWMLRAQRMGLTFFLIPEVLTNFRKGGMSDSYKSGLEYLEIKKKFGFISGFKFFYWKWIVKILIIKGRFSNA